MSQSQYIVESIKSFVKQEQTSYAVLLNGAWGSGKTHFWENNLIKAIEKIPIIEDNSDEKYKHVYISLYGLSNIKEVEKKLLLNLYLYKSKKENENKFNLFKNKFNPFKNEKVIKWGSIVLSGLRDVELFGISASSFKLEKIDIQKLINLSDVVFCFDDLERSSIPINELLGYINELVEHGNAKVIIIANEEAIEEKETYKKIKEKVVGRTLLYKPDHTVVVKQIVNSMKNQDCKKMLHSNLALIEKTFLNSDTNNIRILKQTIYDLEVIYNEVQGTYPKISEKVMREILYFTLAIGFEIRSGAKGNDILESITSNLEFSENVHLKEEGEEEEKEKEKEVKREYLESLKSKYATANRKLYFLKFIEIFIRKGIFDLQLFEYEINEMIELINNNDMECSLFINSEYWDYSDEEFERLSALTYGKILKGEINLYNYYAAYKCYEKLINLKLMDITTEKLKNDILTGLEKVKSNTRLNDKRDVIFKLRSNIGDNETHKLIVHRINSIIAELKLEIERKDTIELFELVKEDIHKFVDIMKTDKQKVPMFNLLDNELFINTILELENRNLYFYNGLLKTRYVIPIKKELEPELKILKSLRIGIEENLKEKPVTPNSILLRELSDFIDSLK